MNFDKFTQKSVECLQNAQNLAVQNGNQEITSLHLLYCLENDADGLIYQVLSDIKVNTSALLDNLNTAIQNLPKVSPAGEAYLSSEANNILLFAQDVAKQMGDEYVSVEHIMLL